MSPVLPKLIIFTNGVKGSFRVGIWACYDERAGVEDISGISKSGSTLLHQNSKHDEKIVDIKSMLSLNMIMYRHLYLNRDHEMKFSCFCAL